MWAALHSGALELHLETLGEDEIISFQTHLQQVMAESYRWDLWGAAYIANGGCSDDGFEYFRAWLISQGRRYYEKCLANPDSIASRVSRDQDNEDEDFLHCAVEAYKEKTGQQMPPIVIERSPEPVGVRWQEKDLPKLYPKLAKKFGLMRGV
jgi:hypothetical protein